ncbi:hypothetical protein BJ684DRAFT_20408 [Piptocephalis cylindrospora]|uniref:RGS domain-containing protein n=1 Tax=Piptocephalis cylindrospora TaxID=1907219 RepID=A0A4P9Y4K3_9FUNG|nr:hypothetical protein BJ684DRAFT_20408 [Piptocephalis cylindrospora]|eukprot:RKP13081.1 hypothetical protein BJ684DRAFT_20408 [Piptocephalis cylindrospora]
MTENRLLMTCGVVSAFYLGLLIPIQVLDDQPAFYLTSPPQRCPAPWIYYPLYASLLLAIFVVAPYVVWRLTRSNADDLGIRRDLLVTAGCAAVLYTLFLIFTLWPPPAIYRYFGPLEFVLFVQLIGHYTSVAQPAVCSWMKQRRLSRDPRRRGVIIARKKQKGKRQEGGKGASRTRDDSGLALNTFSARSSMLTLESAHGKSSREEFYMALAHEPTFEKLEAAAAANFAAETTFFLRALHQLETLYRERKQGVMSEGEDLCQVVCENFIWVDAPFEVNVSQRTRDLVMRRMKAGDRSPDVFSEAKLEVEELVFTNVYPQLAL